MGSYLEAYTYRSKGEALVDDILEGILPQAIRDVCMEVTSPMKQLFSFSTDDDAVKDLWDMLGTLYKDSEYGTVKWVDSVNKVDTLNRISDRIQEDITSVSHFMEKGKYSAEFFANVYETIQQADSALIFLWG